MHGQVVVAERLVADERQRPADGAPVDGEVGAEHFRATRAQRQETRAQAQQRGLPGTVRAREQDDLTRFDLEIGACERGESSEHANGRPKMNDTQEDCSGSGERYGESVRRPRGTRRNAARVRRAT